MIPLFKVFTAPEAADRVAATLASGYLGEGRRVAEFERGFGDLIGSPVRPLAVNSCTSALDLALHLCGVGPGDVVISTPMTCTATNTMIVNRGAKILWADVDPLTGLIDPTSVAQLIDTWGVDFRAILAVDWGGRLCDYDALKAAAGGIPVIEDAAHVAGGQSWESRGDCVAFSFQAIKHLTTGDGGALIVPAVERDRARLLRWYGLDRESSASFRCDQRITEAGYKYHLNDIAASIGLANLPHTEWVVDLHREHARAYDWALAGG